MPTLQLTNNSTVNPITLDLSQYLYLTDDEAPDPYDPAFTQRIFSRSLLKEGATLALTQLVEKEQTWNLLLGPYNTASAMAIAIQQVNEVLNTPGAVLSWQDDGLSQPTYFDLLTGELQIEYSYRKAQKAYTKAKLLTFSAPLGRTAGPRAYAAASGLGPLLMISPYASSGKLALAASAAGFGASGGIFGPNGASGGISYLGNPSLAGDAPAQLTISYQGASEATFGPVQSFVIAALPGPTYNPLIPGAALTGDGNVIRSATAVASAYFSASPIGVSPPGANGLYVANNAGLPGPGVPPLSWSGQHRLFAIARASTTLAAASVTAVIGLFPDGILVGATTIASIAPLTDWGLYDLGTYALRPSEPSYNNLNLFMGAASATVDLTALYSFPDATAWFLSGPRVVLPSDAPTAAFDQFPGDNVILVDDTRGDQWLFPANTMPPAPPGNLAQYGVDGARVTQYSRGLIPRPDPKAGLPTLALLAVRQAIPGTTNPMNYPTYAQLNVQERTRYILP